MFERRLGDCAPDCRVAQRVDGCFEFARLALAGQFAADSVGQGRGRPAHPDGGLNLGRCMGVAGREIEHDLADLLGNDGLAALKGNVEIG